MSLLIISFALCDKSRWPMARLAETNLPVSFGNISFSFYILHGVVLTVIVRLTGHINPVPPVWVSLGITFAACTVAAWLSHRYLESNRIFRPKKSEKPHI